LFKKRLVVYIAVVREIISGKLKENLGNLHVCGRKLLNGRYRSGREDMDWIKVANDRVSSKDFENTTMKPRVP
jgi:hypothetical protein